MTEQEQIAECWAKAQEFVSKHTTGAYQSVKSVAVSAVAEYIAHTQGISLRQKPAIIQPDED